MQSCQTQSDNPCPPIVLASPAPVRNMSDRGMCERVVQVEHCPFGDVPFSLPGTLRILALKCEQAPPENQLSTLLRDCHCLEARSSSSCYLFRKDHSLLVSCAQPVTPPPLAASRTTRHI